METPNLDYVNELSDGDNTFKKDFIQVLKEELEKDKIAYLNAYKNNDVDTLILKVHKLRNKIAIFGLDKGSVLAKEYEFNLKKGQVNLHTNFIAILNIITKFLKDYENINN